MQSTEIKIKTSHEVEIATQVIDNYLSELSYSDCISILECIKKQIEQRAFVT